MTNCASTIFRIFAEFWDHYLTDVAKFMIELARQPHIFYVVLVILLITVFRKKMKLLLESLPVFISNLQKAGLRKVGNVEIQTDVPEAKDHRINSVLIDADAKLDPIAKLDTDAKLDMTNTWREKLDDLSRKAILHIANQLPDRSRKSLSIDVAINLLGKRYFADAFIRNHPNAESDSFFEVKIFSGTTNPDWQSIISRYNDFLREYGDLLSRQVKGYLIIVFRDNFNKGNINELMVNFIFETPDDIEVKFIHEENLTN